MAAWRSVSGAFRVWPLVVEMARRDVVGRYRGSVFGLLWSFFNPVFMLIVYTFAFGVLFKSRWPGFSDDKFGYAVVLYSALLVFNFFTECVNRAPSLILQNANYVKKVVFPLEILPVVALISSLFHFIVGVCVWLIAHVVFIGSLNASLLFLPFGMLPLVLFTSGCSWFLSALGVYLRDVGQVVGVITSALIFLAPVFYPLDSVPVGIRFAIQLNPMTYFVELFRGFMVYGRLPDLLQWATITLISAIFAVLCLRWFRFVRKGFADVI